MRFSIVSVLIILLTYCPAGYGYCRDVIARYDAKEVQDWLTVPA
ncbi:MAG: hypothetical protein AAGI38_24445 [Bacteroidota bacterium]